MANLERDSTAQSVFKKLYLNFYQSLSPDDRDSFGGLNNDEDRVMFISEKFPSVENDIGVSAGGKDMKLALELKEKGNSEFVRGDSLKALDFYSEAAIKADFTSSRHEISLIVANRSAALYHLRKFKEAINDIDYALERGYPAELSYKVLERKSKCLLSLKRHREALESFKKTMQSLDHSKLSTDKKLKMQKNIQIMLSLLAQEKTNEEKNETPTERPELMLVKRNKDFPALSEGVKIEKNDEYGRFGTAAKSIQVGETVLVEKSYCSVLVAEYTTNHCLSCFKRTIAPYPCENCCAAVYCSVPCEKEARKYHQYECSFIDALYKCGMSVLVLMALRIVTQNTLKFFLDIQPTLSQIPAENGKPYKSEDYLTVYHLVRHEHERPADNYLERSAIAVTLLRCLKSTGYFTAVNGLSEAGKHLDKADEVFIGSLILRHLQIMQFNAHEIAEFEVEGTESLGQSQSKFIAGGLYPTLALFNHSCDPGIVRYNLGSTIVVKTVRPLEAGEHVSENYGPIFTVKNRKDRREQLKSQYWFDCNCQPCVENWPMLTDMDKSVIPFRCDGGGKCSAVLHVPYSTQEFMIKCKDCSNHTNLFKGLKALQETDGMFRQALDHMNRGKIQTALDIYLKILTLLHQYLAPPFGDYHLCQQAIRKCMISMGNKYIKEM